MSNVHALICSPVLKGHLRTALELVSAPCYSSGESRQPPSFEQAIENPGCIPARMIAFHESDRGMGMGVQQRFDGRAGRLHVSGQCRESSEHSMPPCHIRIEVEQL